MDLLLAYVAGIVSAVLFHVFIDWMFNPVR